MKATWTIAATWDGVAIPSAEQVDLVLEARAQGLAVTVDAPFHGDPPPPTVANDAPAAGLWEHEVVELFVGATGERGYTELELGPHGHALLLRLADRRRQVSEGVPRSWRSDLDRQRGRWRAEALIAWNDLPSPDPTRLRGNAYAIHGVAASRRYLAARPVPGATPDFHQPDRFAPLFEPAG